MIPSRPRSPGPVAPWGARASARVRPGLAITFLVVVMVGLGGCGTAAPTDIVAGSTAPGLSTSSPSASPPSPGTSPIPDLPTFVPDSSALRFGPALQAELDHLRTAGRLTGLSAAIVFADGSEWQGVSGEADLASHRAVTPETLFSVGSITKTFVAAIVLRLDGEGRLSIDDPISRWLPAFPNAARITVRQLLDQRSGVADYFDDITCVDQIVGHPTAVWTVDRVLRCVGRPYFAPGAGFHYSNTGYVLLGRIVEAVTGTSLADSLRTEFLAPYSLDRVDLQGPAQADTPAPPLAHGYLPAARAGALPVDVTRDDTLLPYTSLATAAGAAGALAATPTDLARWARALYSGAVLDAGTVQEMVHMIPTAPDPRGGYGLGAEPYRFAGRSAWGHRGHLAGYYAEMAYLPADSLSIAVAANADWASPDGLTAALLAVALPAAEPARRNGQGGQVGE